MTPKASTDTPSVETVIARLKRESGKDPDSSAAEIMDEAADLLSTLQHEWDEARSELTAIAFIVSDHPEAGTYAKVEAAEAEARTAREALEEIVETGEAARPSYYVRIARAALSPKDKP